MSELCQITPISAFMSTNLNNKVQCLQELGERIMRRLGWPMVNIELHPDQLNDAIAQACEFFTKYAGYTKEYLIFDSRIYEQNRGIRLDHLFTVANSNYTLSEKLAENKYSNPDYEVTLRENVYVSLSNISKTYFATSSSLSSAIPDDGITAMQIVDETTYAALTGFDAGLVPLFKVSAQKPFTIQCEVQEPVKTINNMFDYDTMDYRKVIDVVSFEEGSTSGISSLFSMESFLSQQSFFSYAMGNFGFDLLSWHVTKDWIDTREKVLGLRRDFQFNNRTQYLRFFPEPKQSTSFVGIFECYVERPLRDIIKEKWVLEYATALSMIMLGRVLTKITGVTLPGGGTINGDSYLQEGIQLKTDLETFLIEGGFGDADPIMFSVG